MPTTRMVQIRNVSEATHRALKVRAAEAGQSLSEYLRGEIEEVAARPTWAQMKARIEALSIPELSEDPTDVLRAMRDAR